MRNKTQNKRRLDLTRRSALWLLLIGSLGATSAEVQPIRPVGGWRYSASDESNFTQTVNYPATHQNSGNHAATALIEGEIKSHPKATRKDKEGSVAIMIANGVGMPLSVDEGGHYQRPYAFGAGSNSLEIRAPGGDKSRQQFYEANAGKVPVKLRVVLSWDTNHTDVDLHVITPRREHAWYGQRTIPSGGSIDMDATDGYGPEIFATPNAEHGTYLIYANYYGGESDKVITTCTATIITNENTPNEKQQTFMIPLRKVGELQLVTSFVY